MHEAAAGSGAYAYFPHDMDVEVVDGELLPRDPAGQGALDVLDVLTAPHHESGRGSGPDDDGDAG